MTDLEQVTRLCQSLGAPAGQAATMAAQLLKRAEQLAAERSIPKVTALESLLEVLVKGRAGEVPARFAPPPDAPRTP